MIYVSFFFFQAEDGIRDYKVTGVQTCALPIFHGSLGPAAGRALHAGRGVRGGEAGGASRGRAAALALRGDDTREGADRKSTRLNSSHLVISYAVFCLKKKNNTNMTWSTITAYQ